MLVADALCISPPLLGPGGPDPSVCHPWFTFTFHLGKTHNLWRHTVERADKHCSLSVAISVAEGRSFYFQCFNRLSA